MKITGDHLDGLALPHTVRLCIGCHRNVWLGDSERPSVVWDGEWWHRPCLDKALLKQHERARHR
jgi:hypothetical protein